MGQKFRSKVAGHSFCQNPIPKQHHSSHWPQNPNLLLHHGLLPPPLRPPPPPPPPRPLPAAFYTAAAEELIDVRKLPTDYDPATFDSTAPPSRPPPSDRVWRLVDDVSSLTLAEAAELSSLLLRRLDIPSAPPIAILNSVAGLGGGAGGATASAAGDKPAAAAEKTVFELRLEGFDAASKIKVIKEIRTFTDLGLKEAKELVEKEPAVIKGGLSKEEAQAIVERMKAIGAKVVMD